MRLFSKLFGKRSEPPPNATQPPVVQVASDDERMRWAIEKANASLHYFKSSLQQPQPQQQFFSVKVMISDGPHTEHIWLEDPSFDEEGNLFGIVGNRPEQVSTVTQRQQIGIDPRFISDWLIIEQGRLIGGYTIRAIRDQLEQKEWPAFDKNVGVFIDEGVDHFAHDFTTPEGAILCLEDAYDDQDLERAMACKDFVEEARMLLQKMNDRWNGEEIVHTTAEVLRLSFIKHLQDNGFPVFRDMQRAFPLREKLSDRLYRITEICIFPDHSRSVQRLYTFKGDEGWRVLGSED